MASLTIDDLMRAYYLGVLGLTPATGNTQSLDNLAAQFFALGPPAARTSIAPTGVYIIPGFGGTVTTTIFVANGSVAYTPVWFDRPQTLSEWAIEVTTGGTAGSLARFGIYSMSAAGTPGTLIDDAGTQATTGTGVTAGVTGRTIVIPTAGWYFFAVAQQGGAGTQATLRSITAGIPIPPVNTASATAVLQASAQFGYLSAGITGAFTSNPAVVLANGSNCPRVQYKISSVP